MSGRILISPLAVLLLGAALVLGVRWLPSTDAPPGAEVAAEVTTTEGTPADAASTTPLAGDMPDQGEPVPASATDEADRPPAGDAPPSAPTLVERAAPPARPAELAGGAAAPGGLSAMDAADSPAVRGIEGATTTSERPTSGRVASTPARSSGSGSPPSATTAVPGQPTPDTPTTASRPIPKPISTPKPAPTPAREATPPAEAPQVVAARPAPAPSPARPKLRVFVQADVDDRAGLGRYTPASYAALLQRELVEVARTALGPDGVASGEALAFRELLAEGRSGYQRLCRRVAAERVLLADVTIPNAGFSMIDSAYWPEVVYTAINCGDGRVQKSSKKRLEPVREESFEYQNHFNRHAQQFVDSRGYFLRP